MAALSGCEPQAEKERGEDGFRQDRHEDASTGRATDQVDEAQNDEGDETTANVWITVFRVALEGRSRTA